MTTIKIMPTQKINARRIEFVKYLDDNYNIRDSQSTPSCFSFIELIAENHYKGEFYVYDLMFAYGLDRSKGTLFLGHFNDGVV